MSAVAQERLHEIAYAKWPDANQKARIYRLARLFGWTERRTKTLFYNEQGSRIRAEEFAALEQHQIQEARNEYQELRNRISNMENRLAQIDASFHSQTIDALRQQGR